MNKKNMSYFNHSAKIVKNNDQYQFSNENLRRLLEISAGWHSKNDPSSSLVAGMVRMGKEQYSMHLDREEVIGLCADTLNCTIEKVEKTLDWEAGYMAWHEGGSAEYHHAWLKEG